MSGVGWKMEGRIDSERRMQSNDKLNDFPEFIPSNL